MKYLRKGDRARLIAGLSLCLFAYLWHRLAMALGTEAGFMRSIGLTLSNLMCRLWAIIPIPVSELVWIFGVIGAVAVFVTMTVKRGFKGFLGACCRLVLAAGVIYALFSAVYLVQYSAPPLASVLGLEVRQYTPQELYDAAMELTGELNIYAEKVSRDEEGLFSPSSFDEIGRRVAASYERGSLSAMYAKGSLRRPKQGVFLSKAMSYLNLAGYYFPPTGESIVSSDIVPTSVPFTTAHETAHSFGIGPEKEASFAAFLCCVESGDDELEYSGLLNGYIYLNNALYRSDKELWQKLYDSVSPLARADLDAKSRHLKKYEGTVNKIGTSVNDAFIKSTGQAEGVQSYGLAADMIIAYYQAK